MKRSTASLAALVGGLVVAPTIALAVPAVTTEPTNLRAGPAFDFPVVDQIPSDVRVNVHGCVRGYRWCDVSWRDARGWVSSDELAYLYGGRRVTFVEYGPRIGLPVVVFAFDSYWDRHYRARSWYAERSRWRTVWRERSGDDRQSDRVKDRRDDDGRRDRKADRPDQNRDGARRDADKREGGQVERRSDRRIGDDRSGDKRSGGNWREGEKRGYAPMDRGQGQRQIDSGRGRGDVGRGAERGGDRGGAGRDGDRR
jgi:uncharacterized protein YraI